MPKKKVELNFNPNWVVSYEYQHGKDLISPGSLIKFKGQRGGFKFVKHVINRDTNKEWIDCVGDTGYRSFYVHDLKGIIKAKKKRVPKNVIRD